MAKALKKTVKIEEKRWAIMDFDGPVPRFFSDRFYRTRRLAIDDFDDNHIGSLKDCRREGRRLKTVKVSITAEAEL